MDTLNGLRAKCYLGILLAGGLAGLLDPVWAGQHPAYKFFLGLILVCVTGFLGGFGGFFLKNLARSVTGRPLYSGQNGDGVLLGALLGSVAGVLISGLFAPGMPTAAGCAVGAMTGSFLGALPDEFISPMLELIHNAEQDASTLPDRRDV